MNTRTRMQSTSRAPDWLLEKRAAVYQCTFFLRWRRSRPRCVSSRWRHLPPTGGTLSVPLGVSSFVRHAMSSTCMYHMSTHANERACLAVHTHLT